MFDIHIPVFAFWKIGVNGMLSISVMLNTVGAHLSKQNFVGDHTC